MKYLYIFLLFLSSALSGFAQHAEYVPGQVLVQLKDDTKVSDFLKNFNSSYLGHIQLHLREQISPTLNIYKIDFSSQNYTDRQVLYNLNLHPQVLQSQFNHYISYRAIPLDPLYTNQWSLHNTSQSGGLNDADIDAPEAWEITTGGLTSTGDTIVVAVIDNGFDFSHEDFAGIFWKNHEEIPNNNIDDDGNGFVDDFHGWDFKKNSDSITGGFHGMPVAGIIGARGNNNKGISGINWDVKILPIVADVDEASAVAAYDYVLRLRKKYNETNGAQGAFVVATNSSWGIDFGQPADAPLWCAMYDSLGKYGVLSVAATINSNQDVDVVGDLPTSCSSEYLISVTSTDNTDNKFFAAGFGATHIDLGAPGVGILTTFPNNGYFNNTGTSFASPHVAGAIALAYSASCPDLMVATKATPDSFALDMKGFLLNGTDVLSGLSGKTVSGGRLNLYKTLLHAENYGICQLASVESGRDADADIEGILDLFPNPASNNIIVRYTNLKTGNNRFIISNSIGQTVIQMDDLIKGKGTRTAEIDISHLPSGIYFLHIASGYRQSAMHKFIKK